MQNRLVLKPMPQPETGRCVGTFDGEPVYVDGMTATLGESSFHVSEFGEDLVAAVDAVATRLFGGDWGGSLSLVTGLNQRTCSRSRIAGSGLPGDVLHYLAQVSASPCPAATGRVMQAAAKILREAPPMAVEEHLDTLAAAVESSVAFVRGMATARAAHRATIRDQYETSLAA